MSFHRASVKMNTSLVAVYSAYWLIESIGGLKLNLCNEYSSGIGKTFLLFPLGLAAGAVNLSHGGEYWVNHTAVTRACLANDPNWTATKYWKFYAKTFGDMYQVKMALTIMTVQFFCLCLLQIGWLLVNAPEEVAVEELTIDRLLRE